MHKRENREAGSGIPHWSKEFHILFKSGREQRKDLVV